MRTIFLIVATILAVSSEAISEDFFYKEIESKLEQYSIRLKPEFSFPIQNKQQAAEYGAIVQKSMEEFDWKVMARGSDYHNWTVSFISQQEEYNNQYVRRLRFNSQGDFIGKPQHLFSTSVGIDVFFEKFPEFALEKLKSNDDAYIFNQEIFSKDLEILERIPILASTIKHRKLTTARQFLAKGETPNQTFIKYSNIYYHDNQNVSIKRISRATKTYQPLISWVLEKWLNTKEPEYRSFLEFLLKHQANPNAYSRRIAVNYTPQQKVKEFYVEEYSFPLLEVVPSIPSAERIAAARLLLERGANPNLKNISGKTALHMARSPEIVEILIKYGADINVQDHEGKTPIGSLSKHLFNIPKIPGRPAFREERLRNTIIALLKNGADPSINNNERYIRSLGIDIQKTSKKLLR